MFYNSYMKNKIFAFWIGDEKTKKTFKNKFNNNFNIEIGPSEKEHEYLMGASPYYKKSFEIKKYSFCSDVWRVWKLGNNGGLYLDISVVIGEQFNSWFKEISKYDISLFKGNNAYLENSVMYAKNGGKKFFKDIFKIYSREDMNPLWSEIMPFVLTIKMREKIKFPNDFDSFEKDKIKLWTLLKIRDSNKIKKFPGGSWTNKGKVSYDSFEERDGWRGWENDYLAKHENIFYSTNATKQLRNGNYKISYRTAFDFYINTDRKDILKEIKMFYRLNKKAEFKYWIIWAKLNRLVLFKNAKGEKYDK